MAGNDLREDGMFENTDEKDVEKKDEYEEERRNSLSSSFDKLLSTLNISIKKRQESKNFDYMDSGDGSDIVNLTSDMKDAAPDSEHAISPDSEQISHEEKVKEVNFNLLPETERTVLNVDSDLRVEIDRLLPQFEALSQNTPSAEKDATADISADAETHDPTSEEENQEKVEEAQIESQWGSAVEDSVKFDGNLSFDSSAKLDDRTEFDGNLRFDDELKLEDSVNLEDEKKIEGDTKLEDNISLDDGAKIEEDIRFDHGVKLDNGAKLEDEVNLEGSANLGDEIKIEDDVKIDDEIKTEDGAKLDDDKKFDYGEKLDDGMESAYGVKFDNEIKIEDGAKLGDDAKFDYGEKLDDGMESAHGEKFDDEIKTENGAKLDDDAKFDYGEKLDDGMESAHGVKFDDEIKTEDGAKLDDDKKFDYGEKLDDGMESAHGIKFDDEIKTEYSASLDAGVKIDDGIKLDNENASIESAVQIQDDVEPEIDLPSHGEIDYSKVVSETKHMTIEDIYAVKDLAKSINETVFMIEMYTNALPDNLPNDVKRQSVLNILKASSLSADSLVQDAYTRIDILNEILEDIAQKTEELNLSNENEIAELEEKIQELQLQIKKRAKYQQAQNTTIAYEIQRIVNIVEFINPE